MQSNKSVLILGARGMVGRSIQRMLQKIDNIDLSTPSRKDLDLTNQKDVNDYFSKNFFDEVYLAAARVGGIYANNTLRGDFIYDNLAIELNVIKACKDYNVGKLLFLGSSCIYPKFANQPIKEQELLNGYLEKTNEPYAIAKIAGIKCCEAFHHQYKSDFRCIMPTNLYGPFDNFNKETSHVIPGLVSRFHNAVIKKDKSISIWGSGSPKREFLHVNDMASASIHVMNMPKEEYFKIYDDGISHINIGSSEEITIKELSILIAKVTKFEGQINFDLSMPDGTPRKLLDSNLIKSLGWNSTIDLADGIKDTYSWYLNNLNEIKL